MKVISRFLLIFSIWASCVQAQWVKQKPNISHSLNGIFMFDISEGWVVGDQGTIYRLTDAGYSWDPETGLDPQFDYNDVWFVRDETKTGWCVGESGRIYERNASGTWELRNTNVLSNLLAISGARGNTVTDHFLWAVGFSGAILFSSNSGATWNTQTGKAGTAYRDVEILNRLRGFITNNNGVILRTPDSGFNWDPVPSNTDKNLYGLFFANTDSGWAVGDSGTILITTTRGDSWSPQSTPTNSRLRAITGINNTSLASVGDAGTAMMSPDGGATWYLQEVQPGLGSDLLAVAMADTDNIWIVGEDGANYYSEGTIQIANTLLPDSLEAGTSQDIHFTTEFNSFVDIFSSANNGATWDTLESNFSTTEGIYQWQVPDTNSNQFLIRMQSSAGHKKEDVQNTSKRLVVFTTDVPLLEEPGPKLGNENDQDVRVQAKITSKRGFSSIRLFFRKGGEVKYDSTGMILVGENLYQGVIRNNVDVDFGKRGLEYYIEAKDNSINKNRATLPKENAKENPNSIQIQVTNDERTVAPSVPGDEKYQMISIPLDYGDGGSMRDVLFDDFGGSYDKRVWRLFRWKNGKQIEFPNSLPDNEEWQFKPGRAFWLVGRSDSITTGEGVSVKRTQNVIQLPETGWHQVANPFAYSVSVDMIELGAQLTGFYEYLPDSGNGECGMYKCPDEVTELAPFKGYFIRSDADHQTLIIPPIAAGNSLNKSTVTTETLAWQVSLNINSSDKSTNILVFGQSAVANDQFDQLDWLDPPSPFELETTSYMPHPDWPMFKGNYKRDIRRLKGEGEVWNFIIESNTEGLVEMQFKLGSRLPEDVEVLLLPRESNLPRNLKTEPDYRYHNYGKNERKEFSLMVGPPEYTDELLSQIQPTSFTLFQNYPNPFNPSTTIRYSLPNPEQVTLKVYNILGEEIVTLVDNELKPTGYHLAIWDGRNNSGIIVASGVYIYRLTAGNDAALTGKMVFIR